MIDNGPFGWAWLKPYALFGLDRARPACACHVLEHVASTSRSFVGRLAALASRRRSPGSSRTLFVDVFRRQTESELRVIRRTARVADLRRIAERILGPIEAVQLFDRAARERRPCIASDELISLVEQRLAANVGAASARSLVSRVVTSETIGVDELKRLAGEAEQIRAYSAELERKSRQIEATAAELAQRQPAASRQSTPRRTTS